MEDFIMNMLTPYNIAELMQVSYDTALDFIKNSGIVYVQVGRQYRVSESVFKAFTSMGCQKSVKSTPQNTYYSYNNKIKLRRK